MIKIGNDSKHAHNNEIISKMSSSRSLTFLQRLERNN